MNLVESLSISSLAALEEKAGSEATQEWQLLSSARLTAQAVIRAITNQKYEQFDEKLATLQEYLQKLTSALEKRWGFAEA